MVYTVYDEVSGKLLQKKLHLKNGKIWSSPLSNESGGLIQGNRKVKGTGSTFFIYRHKMPKDRKPTYTSIVVSIRQEKEETHRTILTVGGNVIS